MESLTIDVLEDLTLLLDVRVTLEVGLLLGLEEGLLDIEGEAD